MRKILGSIDKKTLQARPDLAGIIQDVQAKEAALAQFTAQKDLAKKALKLAEKALKKQLKGKPPKPDSTKKTTKAAAKPKAAAAPSTKKAPEKKSKKTTASA